jgi:hypothetical protein
MKSWCVLGLSSILTFPVLAGSEVWLTEVPDYEWHAGCFGTACGNLMGFWDRHGLTDFYTGPTAGGVAPLDDRDASYWVHPGVNYRGIRSLWASRAGVDGRPLDQPGHIDDYWEKYDGEGWGQYSYESTNPDPWIAAGRQEHAPDCVGDFTGLSQKKWTNMNGECDGNIDAYSFNYWDASGNRRLNYVPGTAAGAPARDLQSGLREWTRYRGYEAEVFTQLSDFNPATPAGRGFTFEHLKAEINAGYPVLLFLQDFARPNYEQRGPMAKANPGIHGMLAYGYADYPEAGIKSVYIRTSWGSGDNITYAWGVPGWVYDWSTGENLSVRGAIGYHPKPRIRRATRKGTNVTLVWDGPAAQLYDSVAVTTTTAQKFVVEKATSLSPPNFAAVTSASTNRTATVSDCCGNTIFYRVRVVP